MAWAPRLDAAHGLTSQAMSAQASREARLMDSWYAFVSAWLKDGTSLVEEGLHQPFLQPRRRRGQLGIQEHKSITAFSRSCTREASAVTWGGSTAP